MMRTHVILGLLFGICHHILAETFDCYVCSYTLSGDPTYDYECVNQPWNVTKGLPHVSCSTPNQCSTRATLNPDRKTIRSVSRSCLTPDAICSGESCCNMDGVYPACEHKCRSDMCNNRNAEAWLAKDGSGAKGNHYSVTSIILIISLCYFIF
ncbi:uncharacterized protein LOC132733383 [Ruditapes philippinarum]|uniref:uncharacterized protein LOC132733383 n=1 Tax=Ruditapes philippinarum TaxID=129788 RepID=UPI00295BEB50|nr:uncharacterized protein LOC132733383 [Ruditapes philippinarum]